MSQPTPHIHNLLDEQLLESYRKDGDSRYVGELFQRYTEMVYLVSMKYLKDPMEAEDMTMKVFEKLMVDLKRYEIRSFRFWLHKVVKHQCLAHLDQRKTAREKQEDFQLDQAEIMENGHEPNLWSEPDEAQLQFEYLEVALTQLNDQQRICVELFYLKKKSYQEVADITGFTLKQVKSYIQNGKRNLKNLITEMGSDSAGGNSLRSGK